MPPDALPVRRPDPVDGRASEASGVQARPPGRARASDGAGRLWCAGAVPHRCPVSVRVVSGGSAAPPAIHAQPVWICLRRPTGLPDPCRAARGGSAWLPGAAGGAVIRHHPAVARRPDRQLLRGGSSSSVLLLRGCSAGSSARQLGQEGGGAWPSALHGILAVLADQPASMPSGVGAASHLCRGVAPARSWRRKAAAARPVVGRFFARGFGRTSREEDLDCGLISVK